ncbi:LemA family protein [Sphingosinicella ginsenosidimutans]|uniref:LemA family protein n=2 Tax=Allosphingosinicella ginsenosidimutans TaxID=1176539 RepID=A0A5C6TZI7_9SPHN|nr:LemA family protein [Sphingosinicella ginsenosidimutans]TXC64996.1 LemA family protein [Sphingosinicella ginsenosidimutans]
MRRGLYAVLAALVVTLSACGINSIPTAEENAKAKWAEVQNQYQRRADLVPNLVATVRAAATQERTVLREVTEARASASRITVTPDQLTDPAAMQRYAAAQTQLTLTLQRLQEAYPELHTNENFLTLQSQLEGTENRIAVARRDYNAAVQAYNTEIRTFPAVIGAKVIYGSQPMQPYQADEAAQRAPSVADAFGNNQ